MNLAVHSCGVHSIVNLEPYIKAKPVGTDKIRHVNKGRSFHQSETNCKFVEYQERMWPMIKNMVP